MTSDSVLEVAK